MADERRTTSLDRILDDPERHHRRPAGLLPVFLWLLFGRDDRAAAAWLLAVLGITDFFDGYIARHFDQASNLGKVLDPVADRLLFFVGGGAHPHRRVGADLVRRRRARPGGRSCRAATLVLAALGARRIDVTWFGKAGTFGLMIAFPLFLAHESALRAGRSGARVAHRHPRPGAQPLRRRALRARSARQAAG